MHAAHIRALFQRAMVTEPRLGERWPLVGRRVDLERFATAIASNDCDGLVLCGPAGVGKTRLADECRDTAEASGFVAARAVASRTAAAVPLGALAHLLPPDVARDGALDPLQLFDRARHAVEALAADAHQPRLVLVVDDLHLLDLTSCLLVAQLLAARLVFLVGTVREGEPVADAISNLWRDERVVRIDLGDLERTSVETLLHLALNGPIDAGAANAFWEASRGNALVLRELVAGATATGVLASTDGVWRLSGPLPSTNRLVELVEARIADVEGGARDALDLLACCEPIGSVDLEAATAPDVLDVLERRGLVQVALEGRRQQVMLAHPVYGEVLRATMPARRAQRLRRAHADAVEARGARRREDPLRVATWRLDAGAPVDPQLLLTACRLARHAHDFQQVQRLAGAAWADEPTTAAGLLLGEADYELGAFDAAETVLAHATELASNDDERLLTAVARTKNLFWGRLELDAARAVNRAARDVVTSKDARYILDIDEASLLMFSGQPGAAVELLARLPEHDEPGAQVARAIVAAPAFAIQGRTAEAIELAHGGFEAHQKMGELLAIAHPGTHVVNEVLALSEAGRLTDAVRLAQIGYDVTVREQVPIAQIWFATCLGRAALIRGLPMTAEHWFRNALALARATSFTGPGEIALRGLAVSRALVGDAAGAQAFVDEIDAAPARLGFMGPETCLAYAWTAVAAGDPVTARSVLTDGVDAALASGHLTSATWFLHDIARLGDPAAVVSPLEDLARRCDGALVPARLHHAAALARDDADALAAVVDELETLGCTLAAAEVASSAADAYRRRGEPRTSSGFATRAGALARAAEGARTPGLVTPDAVVPLSRREREVALLAADGVPSKDIAERLFLSVRTVNNHLQNAYTKLGVSGRAELREALRLAGDGAATSTDAH